MTASERDRQQIAAIIEQYRRGFATMDVEVLKAIWDQDYDNLIYTCSGGSRASAGLDRDRTILQGRSRVLGTGKDYDG